MSVTLIQAPAQYTPGYNEQVFVTSGVTSGKNNYQYIFNIYDSAGTTKLVPSIKIPPRTTDSWAAFDAGHIIESYLASDIAILANGQEGFKSNTNSFYAYTLKVGEEYDLTTTGVTSYPDQVSTSGVVYAWNAALSFQENQNFHVEDYQATNLNTKWLNNVYDISVIDGFKKINLEENEWFYFLNNKANYAYQLYVANDAGDNFYIDNPYASMSTSAGRFLRIPVGTRNLNRIPSSLASTVVGTFPIIKPTTRYYDLSIIQFPSGDSMRSMRFIIPENYYTTSNVKYDHYRLHWLNSKGAFDSFTFNMVSRINEDIERKQYKKLYGSKTGRWSYNTYDRGATTYNTSIKDKITLNSDWITQSECAFLENLVTSPEVYWDSFVFNPLTHQNDLTDNLIAINITNTSYEKKKVINDFVFNITIEIEITQKRFTQRG